MQLDGEARPFLGAQVGAHVRDLFLEKLATAAFDKAFHNCRSRIIVATFSSNVHRIQQVIDTAVRYKRHVAVLGRSMVNVVNISLELGYITAPEGTIVDIDEIHHHDG